MLLPLMGKGNELCLVGNRKGDSEARVQIEMNYGIGRKYGKM